MITKLVAAFVLVASLGLTPAAAQFDGALRADAMLIPSGTAQSDALFFWLRSDTGSDPIDVNFTITATTMHADVYERRAAQVGPTPAVGPVDGIVQGTPPQVTHTPYDLEDVAAIAARATGDMIVTVRAAGGGVVSIASATGSLQATPFGGGAFTFTGGVQEDDAGGDDDGGFTFSRVQLPGEQVRLRTETYGLSAVLTGDFIVEVQHVEFRVAADGEDLTIDTTTKFEAVDPALPDETMAAARSRMETFARLAVTDAVIELEVPTFDGVSEWLAARPEVEAAGPVVLVGAIGNARIGTRDYSLQGERVTLADVPPLALGAADDGMLRITAADRPQEPAGFMATTAATAVTAGTVGLAVALLAAVIGIAWLWRRGDMPHVEDSIVRGRYRRAAAVAAKIAKRQPHREEAVVARAVALAKSGRHDQVIREVEHRLRLHDATDGVLHYLIGASYWQRGARSRARKYMREAVRRTPELRDAVAEFFPLQTHETQAYV